MEAVIKTYNAKVDSKKRVTLRGTVFQFYQVSELANGSILLEPRELAIPFEISQNSLEMMDESVENMKKGIVSEPVDFDKLP